MKITKRLMAMAMCGIVAATSMIGMSASAVNTFSSKTSTAAYYDINSPYYLSVKHYFQSGNQSWSNDYCGNSKVTIAYGGCAITSFAMVENFFGGTSNPGDVNKAMGASAYPNFDWSLAASLYNLNYNYKKDLKDYSNTMLDKGAAHGTIANYIREENIPVIVKLTKKNNASDTHFVVAYGVSPQNAIVYIHDPSYWEDRPTLEKCYDDYYVSRTIVYRNN